MRIKNLIASIFLVVTSLLVSTSSYAALGVEGAIHATSGSATSLPVTISTATANDVVMIIIQANQAPIISVTSAHLTFTRRAQAINGIQTLEEWSAPATGTLTSEVITVTQSGANFMTLDAFGIIGANTSTIFDPNVLLPVTALTGTAVLVTTSNANDIIIGSFRLGGVSSTPGSGFTLISSADFQTVEYQIVSTTQTLLSVGQSSSTGGIIGDAVMASGSATPTHGSLLLRKVGQ